MPFDEENILSVIDYLDNNLLNLYEGLAEKIKFLLTNLY